MSSVSSTACIARERRDISFPLILGIEGTSTSYLIPCRSLYTHTIINRRNQGTQQKPIQSFQKKMYTHPRHSPPIAPTKWDTIPKRRKKKITGDKLPIRVFPFQSPEPRIPPTPSPSAKGREGEERETLATARCGGVGLSAGRGLVLLAF
jgi:hypothetical protein